MICAGRALRAGPAANLHAELPTAAHSAACPLLCRLGRLRGVSPWLRDRPDDKHEPLRGLQQGVRACGSLRARHLLPTSTPRVPVA